MASADIENNSHGGMTVTADQPNSTTKPAPAYDASAFHDHSHSCNDPSHHHDMPSFFDPNDLYSSLGAAKKEMPAKRKGKKNQQKGTVRAESIPGHRGDQNIDDLMNFINSPPSANDKKQKKKVTATAN